MRRPRWTLYQTSDPRTHTLIDTMIRCETRADSTCMIMVVAAEEVDSQGERQVPDLRPPGGPHGYHHAGNPL